MVFSARNVALSVGLLALATLPAAANDITFGGDARAFAMGGAGIASLAGNSISGMGSRNNPASLAFAKGLMRFHFPNIGARADGAISVTKALDYLASNGSGADATDLARRFSSENSSFGFNASLGSAGWPGLRHSPVGLRRAISSPITLCRHGARQAQRGASPPMPAPMCWPPRSTRSPRSVLPVKLLRAVRASVSRLGRASST